MFSIGFEEAGVTEAKFKVGDRVRVLINRWEDSVPKGSLGIVHEVLDRTPPDFTVKIDGGDGFAWFFKSYELERAAPIKPKFKVGDRVVTEIGDDDIGTVRGYRDGRYSVQFQSQRSDTSDQFIWNDFELDPATTKFKIGDLVRVIDGDYADKVFQITDVDDDMGLTYYWVLPHGYCFQEARLELAPDCAERKVEQDNTPAPEAKPQPKFKAGDVVVYKESGKEAGTIKCVKTHFGGYGAPYRGVAAYDYVNGGWDLESSLVIAPTVTPHIVALVKNGKPLPSRYPHVHDSVEDATAEAERLARNNPGQEFAVYQRVAGRVAEVQVNMKEVA